ncbi:MAG TPA: GNAT family N-acetyltransferase [Gemmatimonadaceae bacterium]|nr:GNAT family N-acetyltransferase [Gemmatimonadaceae bacterium]
MTTARSWGRAIALDGPHPVRREDIPPLNQVFSDAFTERYRRDGMVGVRVPYLNPAVWRYAIEDAAGGAMLWRGDRGEIIAFNVAHRSGVEGWMGPLAVRPEAQGSGVGKEVVKAGIEWLRAGGCRVIGLETMPRTMDNIGFYSALGFAPGRLTITVTLDAAPGDRAPTLLGRLPVAEKESALEGCRALVETMRPGYDFTREIALTDQLALGDTVLLRDAGGAVRGFALCHTAPLVEGRAREELRVLKLALAPDESLLDPMLRLLQDYARRSATRRVAFRIQGEYGDVYRRLVQLGARVRWTDLRMTLDGYPEPAREGQGVVLSNWEI